MTMTFKIEYKTLWGESLVLVAAGKRYPMQWTDGDIWTVTLDKCTSAILADHGYELVRDGVILRQEWEHHHTKVPRGATEVREWWIGTPESCNPFPRKHSMEIFDRKGYRGAGTAVPVFSLRSYDGFGIGEFYDLRQMVDWAEKTGQHIIQLLPINDTTMTHGWMDSYPYNANSTFALHPQFINLPAAGVKVDAAYKKLRAELNALPKVDYERVNGEKDRLLREAFARTGGEVLASSLYKDFFEANREWLLPYAVFSALRDEKGTAEFAKWGAYAKYSRRKVEEYYSAHSCEVDYHCFVQYHLDRQLKEVCDYAHKKGVAFKGDLPIGISRTSVDAWCYPKLFNGGVFRRFPHRPHPRILPHLGDPRAGEERPDGAFQPGAAVLRGRDQADGAAAGDTLHRGSEAQGLVASAHQRAVHRRLQAAA